MWIKAFDVHCTINPVCLTFKIQTQVRRLHLFKYYGYVKIIYANTFLGTYSFMFNNMGGGRLVCNVSICILVNRARVIRPNRKQTI